MRLASFVVLFAACRATVPPEEVPVPSPAPSYAELHANDTVSVKLEADLSAFDASGREMLALLVQACQLTDDLYWKQSWGDKEALLERDHRPEAPGPGRAELRAVGPVERRCAVRRRRGPAPARGPVLPRGHDEGGVRGVAASPTRPAATRCSAAGRTGR